MTSPDELRDSITATARAVGVDARRAARIAVLVEEEVRQIVAAELDAADQDESVSLAARAARWRAEQ